MYIYTKVNPNIKLPDIYEVVQYDYYKHNRIRAKKVATL